MKPLLTRIAVAAGVCLAVTASLTATARPASADDTLHNWTVDQGNESCAGKCTPTGTCCRITIIIPN